mmetsp:Transcript_10327/g.33886  ORF Transcript_10327/g.33886 Transcript_10327/m.33886 type:complete len:254 (+) Transcript_10327:472-1233(+)
MCTGPPSSPSPSTHSMAGLMTASAHSESASSGVHVAATVTEVTVAPARRTATGSRALHAGEALRVCISTCTLHWFVASAKSATLSLYPPGCGASAHSASAHASPFMCGLLIAYGPRSAGESPGGGACGAHRTRLGWLLPLPLPPPPPLLLLLHPGKAASSHSAASPAADAASRRGSAAGTLAPKGHTGHSAYSLPSSKSTMSVKLSHPSPGGTAISTAACRGGSGGRDSPSGGASSGHSTYSCSGWNGSCSTL